MGHGMRCTNDAVGVGGLADGLERRGDSYRLLLALDLANSAGRRYPPVTPQQQAAPDEAAAALRQRQAELQQRLAALPPTEDRASFFIGNTIANLRGLDPAFHCGRGLTLVDGRRAPAGPSPGLVTDFSNQAFPPRFKEPRVDAWLLKADGTQAMPAIYHCVASPVRDGTSLRRVDISYEFTVAEGAEAWPVAIRIDDDFCIEKLEPQPAPQ